MCNEKSKKEKETPDNIQLLFYRLDQLEENQRKDTETIMTTLQLIQNGVNDSHKTLIQHTEQITQLKTEVNDKLDIDKYIADKEALLHRLDIYQKILMGIGVAVGGAILVELIKII